MPLVSLICTPQGRPKSRDCSSPSNWVTSDGIIIKACIPGAKIATNRAPRQMKTNFLFNFHSPFLDHAPTDFFRTLFLSCDFEEFAMLSIKGTLNKKSLEWEF